MGEVLAFVLALGVSATASFGSSAPSEGVCPVEGPVEAPQAVASETVQLRLASVFGDHMVLPRDVSFPVWGSAKPGERVHLRFGETRLEALAGADGKWRCSMPALGVEAEPRSLEISTATSTLRCEDVVVGDIWFCAGQSNMAFELSRSAGAAEALGGAGIANLRLFQARSRIHPGNRAFPVELLESIEAESLYESTAWLRSTPESASGFSAVAWHFGRELHQELGIPIGLIHVAVGGTPIEAWIPREALSADPELSPLSNDWLGHPEYPKWCQGRAQRNLESWFESGRAGIPHHPFEPGFLFEAGVAPYTSIPVRGVLWYQGESNATLDGGLGRPVDVAVNLHKLRAWASSWRAAWGRGDLPILTVQLPGLDREWSAFREAQARLEQDDDHVHGVVTLDLGHPTDVHPPRKRAVGERLALRALAQVHGRGHVDTGPRVRTVELREYGGVLVRFRASRGLRTTDGLAPRCFAVAGEEGGFRSAQARIHGEGVLLHCPDVPRPAFVRYAFENDPRVNLVNLEGLPTAPFRTDVGPVAPRVRVACIGDSITYGTGIEDRGRNAYPVQLGEALGPDYHVRNFGRPGAGVVRDSMRGSEKRAYLFSAEHRSALAWDPDVVICNLGINDVMDWEAFGRGAFARDYAALIEAYRGLPASPRIVLWAPLAPLFEGQAFFTDPNVLEISEQIGGVARELGLETLDLRTPLASHPEWFDKDSIHPDARGAAEIARTVEALFR